MSAPRQSAREGPRRRSGESGFALLLVFAMAAIIAVSLYYQVPSVIFEAQRQKEQLLIERGEQYQRAIQLYYRKVKNYPPTLDALEGTNNVRFLRKRYDDPMTGKSEWRIIHIANGVFTDSLTQKKKNQGQKPSVNTFITEGPSLGGQSNSAGKAGAWARLRLRLTRGGTPATNPGADPGFMDLNTSVGLDSTGRAADDPARAAQPGQTPQDPAAQAAAGAAQAGALGASPYSTQPGNQGAPTGFGGQPGMSGMPGGGFPGGVMQGSNEATRMIQELLTRPRPGGLSGASALAGMPTGNGIAGVASTLEDEGIKLYNEKSKYNEWEFLYDLAKDKALNKQRPGGVQGASPMGNSGSRMGSSSGPFYGDAGGSGFGMPGGYGQVTGAGAFGRSGMPASSSGSSGSSGSGGFGSGFSSGGFGSGFGGSGSGSGTGTGTAPKPSTTPGSQSTPTQQNPQTSPPRP